MDSTYFIEIIIQGRDQFSSALRDATNSLRTDLNRLRNEMRGFQNDAGGFSRAGTSAGTSTRNLGQGIRALRREYRDTRVEVEQATKYLLTHEEVVRRSSSSNSLLARSVFALQSAFRGMGRAAYDLRRGIRDIDSVTKATQGPIAAMFYNFTQGATSALDKMSQFNLILTVLATGLATLLPAIVSLVGAFVALGSAVSVAAAGIGGALVAGISTLLPLVGLLIIAFQRLSLIFQAVGFAQKGIKAGAKDAADAAKQLREATERVVDAQYTLKNSHIAIAEAAFNERQAQLALVEARKQAARQLIDRQFEKKEAILSERGATLALLEARRRLRADEINLANQDTLASARANFKNAQAALRLAQQRGDPGEIADALSRLGAARSSLVVGQGRDLQLKQDKLAVEQAQLDVAESRERTKRAEQDLNKARKEGVELNPAVVQAEHSLRDAIRGIAEARRNAARATRELTDAETDLTSQRKKGGDPTNAYGRVLQRLDPTELEVVSKIQEFIKKVRVATKPIVDPILAAIGNGIDKIGGRLFDDPRLRQDFAELGRAVGDAIGDIVDFLTSPDMKDFIHFLTTEATKDIPVWIELFKELITFIRDVAREAMPLFDHMLGGAVGLLGGQNARNESPNKAPGAPAGQTRLGGFFQNAGPYVDQFFKLIGSFAHLLGTIIKAGAPTGLKIMENMAATFDRWSDSLSKGKGAQEFFATAARQSARIFESLGRVIGAMYQLSKSGVLDDLLDVFDMLILPAFVMAITAWSKFLTLILKISETPVIGDLVKWSLAMLLFMKFIPGRQKMSMLVKFVETLFGLNAGKLATEAATAETALVGGRGRVGLIRALGRAGLAGAAFAAGFAIGKLIDKLTGGKLSETGGRVIGAAVSGLGAIGIHVGPQAAGNILNVEASQGSAGPIGYAARSFLRAVMGGIDPGEFADKFRKNHENFRNFKFLWRGQQYEEGGAVEGEGAPGGAVHAIVHAGEWVLNKAQQTRAAIMTGTSTGILQNMLFGDRDAWTPTQFGLPAFASGGIVTVPAVGTKTGATGGVEQNFEIVSSSPDVDISYIMRVAKTHMEVG